MKLTLRTLGIVSPLFFLSMSCTGPTPPSVGVGSPAVFTTVHLIAAEVSVNNEGAGKTEVSLNNGPFTAAEMKRYFESTSDSYAKDKTRMDAMLDGQQRQTAILQAVQSQTEIGVAANIAAIETATANGQAAPTAPTVSPQTGPVNQAILDQFKPAFTDLMSAPVIDSPFDQLDRVADFYAAYVVKNLRVRGDSSVVDQDVLAQQVLQLLPDNEAKAIRSVLSSAATQPYAQEGYANAKRLLLVVFQTHVDPGNMSDVWTGIRLKIASATNTSGQSIAADQIKVIRLHPTRFYDIDQQTFGESTSRAFAGQANVSVTTPKAGATINVGGNNSEEEEARQKYLSRVSKITSFADATDNSFGFNFYPSNVRVDKQYIPFGLLLTGNATTYKTNGYLEGGARDCAAILVVPRNAASFTVGVSQMWGSVDCGQPSSTTSSGTFTVDLPTWKPVELLAATLGAGPTSRPASSATTKP